MSLTRLRRNLALRVAAVGLLVQLGCSDRVTMPPPAAEITLRVTSPLGSHEARGSYDDLLAPLFALQRDGFVADGQETMDPAALAGAATVELAGPGGTRLALHREDGALVGADGTRLELDVAAGRAELRRGALWTRVELDGLDAENTARSLGLLALSFAAGRPVAALGARDGKLLGLIIAIAGAVYTIWVAVHTYNSMSECESHMEADAQSTLTQVAACELEDEEVDGVWVCYAAGCDCGFLCVIGINDVDQPVATAAGETEAECHANVTSSYPNPEYYGARYITRADLAAAGVLAACPRAVADVGE